MFGYSSVDPIVSGMFTQNLKDMKHFNVFVLAILNVGLVINITTIMSLRLKYAVSQELQNSTFDGDFFFGGLYCTPIQKCYKHKLSDKLS